MFTWLGNKFHSTAIFLFIPLHDNEMKFCSHRVIPWWVHYDLQSAWNSPPGITFYEFRSHMKRMNGYFLKRRRWSSEPLNFGIYKLIRSNFHREEITLLSRVSPSSKRMNPLVWGEWRMRIFSEKLPLSLLWSGAKTSLTEPVKFCYENAN